MIASERRTAVRHDARGLEFVQVPGHFHGAAGGDLRAKGGSEGREAELLESFGVAAASALVWLWCWVGVMGGEGVLRSEQVVVSLVHLLRLVLQFLLLHKVHS